MDAKKAQEKLDELKKKREGLKNFWNPKPGKDNYIRILPHWTLDTDAAFYYKTAYHKNLGPGKYKRAVCLIAEGQESCPVCQVVKELWKTKNNEDAKLAKSIKAIIRVYYNIIDLNDKKKGVQVWQSGVEVLEQLLGFVTNEKYGDFTDPAKGRNIVLIFTEGKNTKSNFNEYAVQPDPDRTSIDDPQWLESLVDLSKIVKTLTYDELSNVLYEGTPTGAEDC
jgi:hypothetical protein